MRNPLFVSAAAALLCLTAVQSSNASPAAPSTPPAAPAAADTSGMSNDEKAIYALGFALWRNLQTFDLSPAEIDLVKRGLSDAASGATPVVTLEEARPLVDTMRKGRMEKKLAVEKEAGAAYVAKAAAEPGAVKSESGMIYREITAGTGASPAATDTVKVHYRGTLIDGTEFDSSYKRDKPAEFALNRVIKCWTEGVGKMKVGGKAALVCPPDIAYGDRGRPSIPGGATLLFEVELLEIVSKAAAETPQPESGAGDEHPGI